MGFYDGLITYAIANGIKVEQELGRAKGREHLLPLDVRAQWEHAVRDGQAAEQVGRGEGDLRLVEAGNNMANWLY